MKSFSCVVPAYNEEEMLVLTLPVLFAAIDKVPDYRGRVVVVDNNSSDNTAAVARDLGAEVVFEPVNQISKARNCGGRACPDDDYLFFIDADTYIDGELLRASLTALDSGAICGGGALVKMDSDKGQGATLIWSFISRATQLAAGAYIFCLNRAFKGTGGFNEEIYAAEDVYFSVQLKRWGKKHGGLKFRILKQFKVVTSDRKVRWYSHFQIFKMLLLTCLMPWRLKNREKLDFWYKRPRSKNNNKESQEVE